MRVVAAGAAAVALNARGEETRAGRAIEAIAFDAFPIFDPRPVLALADQYAPRLSDEWRTRQFEYSWLRVAAQKYADFEHVTRDALVFAAKKVKVELSASQRDMLVNAYFKLKPWPEVAAAMKALRRGGYRLAFLSNFTAAMLDGCIRASELRDVFEQVISADDAKSYKPDPRAYQLACDRLKLKREQILFVAFAGWDAAGAKLFGLPTFWVNRLEQPVEELGACPDATGKSLSDLVKYLNQIDPRASTDCCR
jgi:2-haloacid dehalogenase